MLEPPSPLHSIILIITSLHSESVSTEEILLNSLCGLSQQDTNIWITQLSFVTERHRTYCHCPALTRLNPEIQMLTENKLIVLPPSTILSIMHIHYSWQVQQSIQQLHRMLMSQMSRGLVQRGE